MTTGASHGEAPTCDMSGLGVRASGAPVAARMSHITEHALIHAYRASDVLEARIERCACGGRIVAPDSHEAIAQAVSDHQQTAVHGLWRTWQEALA